MKISVSQAKALGIEVPRSNKLSPKKKRAEEQGQKELRQRLFDEACLAHGLPVPVPEYKFHPTRQWRLDYVFGGLVALEICGGVWTRGHHSRGQDQVDDWEKWMEAQMMGFLVLWATPQQVESGEAFALVKRALEASHE